MKNNASCSIFGLSLLKYVFLYQSATWDLEILFSPGGPKIFFLFSLSHKNCKLAFMNSSNFVPQHEYIRNWPELLKNRPNVQLIHEARNLTNEQFIRVGIARIHGG